MLPPPPHTMSVNTLFAPAIRVLYLVGLLNRLNDCVTLKYQHIVYLCILIAALPSNSVNAAIG